MASDAPTVPVRTAAEVLAEWADRGPAAVCVGGFGSPREAPHERIHVFTWPPDTSKAVLDVWVPAVELDGLCAALGARRGGCDSMYATGWSVAWASGPGEFAAWTHDGPAVTLADLRSHGAVSSVEGWLAEDWIERGVRARLASGGELGVLTAHEPAAAMGGFIYDGLDLLADSGWIHDCGRDLARALGVPYVNLMP